ncbi:apolipoprotein N-acyltransferase [Bryocella elongata]|uniref:apolipoprotein N-acyltransferase n=1 Tax=Bryocella elongata TaxID=863522 RepID=UPI001F3AACE9|nr:apolipoprotein N-acyltransferase [Bryocella elongata]
MLQALPFPLEGAVPLWRRAFCWICLVPLLLAIRDIERYGKRYGKGARWFHAAAIGYLCGIVWYFANCYWIEGTMQLYGGLPVPAAWGVLLLFSLYLGLYHALFCGLLWAIQRRRNWCTALVVAPLVWVAVELARTQITGFPWDLLGYTQIDHLILNRLAPLTGVMGLSLVVALVNVLWLLPFACELCGTPRKLAIGSLALATTLLALSANWWTPPPDTRSQTAVLLQDNLNIGGAAQGDSPTDDSRAAMLSSFVALSESPAMSSGVPERSGYPTVILWPEAPTDFFDSDPQFRSVLNSLAINAHSTVIAEDVTPAATDSDGTRHLYNSARLTTPAGRDGGRYDKMHLVPFGEYTPYKPLFFFAGKILDDLPFVPGLSRNALVSEGHRYGVFICYESIFGDEVRRLTQDGAQVLVNLSDDGWYGDSSAPWEHLDMARMRAIENNRWVLRSTNTGVTAVIDPHGRVVAQLPRHVRSSLAAGFAFRDGLTPYTRFGDWVGWLCALMTALALGASFFTRRPVH